MAIRYFEEELKSGLKNRRRLSKFLSEKILQFRGVEKIDLNIVFCTDEYLLEKNQVFLEHDTLTDVITFDLSDQPSELLAEIYISIERIQENATKFADSYLQELHRVLFHGVLHLCGFNDKTEAEQEEMRKQEQTLLKEYFEDETGSRF